MRAARARWPDDAEIFGAAESNPEDELMLMKGIFLTDIDSTDGGKSGMNAIKSFSFRRGKSFSRRRKRRVRAAKRKFSLNLIKFSATRRAFSLLKRKHSSLYLNGWRGGGGNL